MIWIKEWRKDVKQLEAKVRELKLKLRNDWRVSYPKYGDASADQFELLKLKFQLTSLYCYRAMKRDKVHTEKELPISMWGVKQPDTNKYIVMEKEEIELRKQAQTILDLANLEAVGLLNG